MIVFPNAKSPPSNEKIIAWLSLEGSPKNQHKIPKRTMTMKQERQTMLVLCFEDRLINENIVLATLAPKSEVRKTPKKLKIPDKSAPCQSFSAPEATIEKIEFGASVQPLTKTTDKAKKNTKKSRGVFKFAQKSI